MRPTFKMGRLDHVHIHVPDRAEAARWYAEHLGFEPVDSFDFWATGFEGGPLQISADGGQTMLALFEDTAGHPMVTQQTGVAFTIDPESFIKFARSLPCGIDNSRGEPLVVSDLVDYDMCWAFDLSDPWGNLYELQLLRLREGQDRTRCGGCSEGCQKVAKRALSELPRLQDVLVQSLRRDSRIARGQDFEAGDKWQPEKGRRIA